MRSQKHQTNRCREPHAVVMTVIEIRPHRLGWKTFEAPGVEPVFPRKIRQSTMLRIVPASAQARFGFSIQPETLSASFRSMTRIESCETRPRCAPQDRARIVFVCRVVDDPAKDGTPINLHSRTKAALPS